MNDLRFETEQELKNWLKDAKYEDTIMLEYDESGNKYYEFVVKKNDKFYSVNMCNDILSPVRPKQRDEEDWYMIYEVNKIINIVTKEEVTWEYVND